MAAADTPSVIGTTGACKPLHFFTNRITIKEAGVQWAVQSELQMSLAAIVQRKIKAYQRRNQPGSTDEPQPFTQIQVRQPHQHQPAAHRPNRSFAQTAAERSARPIPALPPVVPTVKKDPAKVKRPEANQQQIQPFPIRSSVPTPVKRDPPSAPPPIIVKSALPAEPSKDLSVLPSSNEPLQPPPAPLLDFDDLPSSIEKEEPLCPADLE